MLTLKDITDKVTQIVTDHAAIEGAYDPATPLRELATSEEQLTKLRNVEGRMQSGLARLMEGLEMLEAELADTANGDVLKAEIYMPIKISQTVNAADLS